MRRTVPSTVETMHNSFDGDTQRQKCCKEVLNLTELLISSTLPKSAHKTKSRSATATYGYSVVDVDAHVDTDTWFLHKNNNLDSPNLPDQWKNRKEEKSGIG